MTAGLIAMMCITLPGGGPIGRGCDTRTGTIGAEASITLRAMVRNGHPSSLVREPGQPPGSFHLCCCINGSTSFVLETAYPAG
jgi:hypothetical protein